MKGYLLDTQVFLWAISDETRLSEEAISIISDVSIPVYVSAVTSWEIAIKKSLGKLKAPDNIDKVVEELGFLKLPVYLHHGDVLLKLPLIHKDPFDRMLIAQAISEDLIIITSDRKFEAYGIPLVRI